MATGDTRSDIAQALNTLAGALGAQQPAVANHTRQPAVAQHPVANYTAPTLPLQPLPTVNQSPGNSDSE